MRVNLKIIVAVLVLGLVALAVYLVRKNTSFLTFNPAIEDILQNNSSSSAGSNAGDGKTQERDFSQLQAQTLSVPEKYQSGIFATPKTLNLPQGFEASVFVAGLEKPRFFELDSQGNLLVTDIGAGTVVLVKDNDKDSAADETITVASGLRNPHGISFYNNDLYVGEEHQVVVFRNLGTDGSFSEKQVLVPNLPSDGGHYTRTVFVGPDEKLYVSIGSSCNVCEENDPRRAAVVRYNLDGTGEELFATGLRNSVGLALEKYIPANVRTESGERKAFALWSVDNGRDLIGDNLPPEEVNLLFAAGNYGWPYCYGRGIANPEYPEREDFCQNETKFPTHEMQAHSAPLGLNFSPLEPEQSNTTGLNLPAELGNQLFIAFHGSWNRTVPTGYKIVRLDVNNPNAQTINFATGWLEENGNVWGRPVDIDFDQKGDIFITDDRAGAIYKITYKNNQESTQ